MRPRPFSDETRMAGLTRYAADVLRVAAIDKQGRRRSIAFMVGLLYSAEQQVTGIVAVV